MEMDFPDPKWFVRYLIPEGLTILAGPAKIGKSFLAWNIAAAVASGGKALSALEVPEQRKVLYMVLEDPIVQLQERLKLICPEGVPENLQVVADFGGVKLGHVGIQILEKYIEATDTEMVIIDTWKHLIPETLGKGTAYETDYNALIPVQRLAQELNISILLVTHTRKARDPDNPFNEIQGSVGTQAGCDTMLMLSRSDGNPTLNVTGRRVRGEEYAIELHEGTWVMHGSAEVHFITKERQRIVDHLAASGYEGLSNKALAELTGTSPANITKLTARMSEDGIIKRSRTRGPWILAEDGTETIKF